MKTTKLSNKIIMLFLLFLPAPSLFAKVTTVKYHCDDDKTLTVSYFFGETTDNATSTFDGWPHKMYLDESISDQMIYVYKEEPYILHVENAFNIKNAKLISITKQTNEPENGDEKPYYELLYKNCIPGN